MLILVIGWIRWIQVIRCDVIETHSCEFTRFILECLRNTSLVEDPHDGVGTTGNGVNIRNQSLAGLEEHPIEIDIAGGPKVSYHGIVTQRCQVSVRSTVATTDPSRNCIGKKIIWFQIHDTESGGVMRTIQRIVLVSVGEIGCGTIVTVEGVVHYLCEWLRCLIHGCRIRTTNRFSTFDVKSGLPGIDQRWPNHHLNQLGHRICHQNAALNRFTEGMQHLQRVVLRSPPTIHRRIVVIRMSVINRHITSTKAVTALDIRSRDRWIIVTITDVFEFKGDYGSSSTDCHRCPIRNGVTGTDLKHQWYTLTRNFHACEFGVIKGVALNQNSWSKPTQNTVIGLRQIQNSTGMRQAYWWSILPEPLRRDGNMTRIGLPLTRF